MNESAERLDFWTCFFLDNGNHTVYKSPDVFENPKNTHKYFCKAHGTYLFGDGGRVISILICLLIFFVGIFGVITNVLNVLILRKSFPGKSPVSFKESLIHLAVIEFILCWGTIGFSLFTILILENLSRNLVTIEIFHKSNLLFTLMRTISVYTTILITLERYLVVAYPIKAKNWFYEKPWKSRLALAAVIVYAVLLNLPWMFKSSITQNEYVHWPEEESTKPERLFGDYEDDSDLTEANPKELMNFPYIITRNALAKKLNRYLQETLLALDFVVPLPLLLTINGLLYNSIRNWKKNHAAISGRQKRDIKTATMFSIVVIILLACHSVSCAVFFTSRVQRVTFRELMLLQSLAVVVGASVNILVYYSFGSGFQREFWILMRSIFGERWSWINRHYEKFRKDSGPEISMHSQN